MVASNWFKCVLAAIDMGWGMPYPKRLDVSKLKMFLSRETQVNQR